MIVLDFTDRQNNKIVKVLDQDLRNLITNIGSFKIKELFCNEMVTVQRDKLYFIPCYARGIEFLVWFNIQASQDSFFIDTFASRVKNTEVDRIGRNSMIAYKYLDIAWVMSSSVDNKTTFSLSMFDLINVRSRVVRESQIGIFRREDFPFEDGSFLQNAFNIRDIKLFSQPPDIDKSQVYPKLLTHNIIASCFNNGLLFFQSIAQTHKMAAEAYRGNGDSPNPFAFMSLTHVLRIPEAGKLFSFNDFYSLDIIPYKLFLTKANPASVYEISINEHFNVRIDRIYTVPEKDIPKFIGQDILSMNEKYIAHLLIDLEDMLEVVRIYNRNETNFAYGHSDIKLNKFLTPIASITFLDSNNIYNLFVRNAFFGNLYKINDIELVVNTRDSNFEDWVNKTYVVNITAYNSENSEHKVSSKFRLTFAHNRNMDSYYIGDQSKYIYGHSYGDPSFSEIVSDYYLGPDLKFNLSLKEIVGWEGYTIHLPNITTTSEASFPQKLHQETDCKSSFFNRFLNRTSQIENIAFYCIHEHSIEKHIFDTVRQEEINWSSNVYPRYKFFDFAVVLRSKTTTSFDDELIIVSEEILRQNTEYFMHFFDVRADLVTWRNKVRIQLPNRYSLRQKDPLIDFDQGSYLVFIDSRETTLFFISREGVKEAEKFISRPVQNLDVFKDLLFVTHFNYNKIPVYKVSRFTDTGGKVFLQVDLLSSFIFKHNIHDFDTKNSKDALVFSQDNIIELWEIVSPYKIDYIRMLPFFKYFDTMKFYISEGENKVVFARYDRFLYVIMVGKSDPKLKKLFCFNMLKVSHDALYSVIQIDRDLADKSNGLLVESSTFESTIYIYLFYGGSIYQLIKFEPENLLKKLEVGGEIFLPKTDINLRTFPDANITLTLFPIYEDYNATETQSIDLFIVCRNFGFKIESMVAGNEIIYSNKEGETFMSLLDHFDGFNNTFELIYNEPGDKDYLTYKFESDSMQSYLLESVNSSVKPIYSLEFNEKVAVFYNSNSLLQVYDVDETIQRIGTDFDYSKIFNG
jgi:hypothetical protein